MSRYALRVSSGLFGHIGLLVYYVPTDTVGCQC